MSDGDSAARDNARVDVFFYGSFMGLDVLRGHGVEPAAWRTAIAGGYRLAFSPLATLERAAGEVVYGTVCSLTHHELRVLYSQGWLGAYQPEAILVQSHPDAVRAALCYIAHGATGPRPSADYVSRVVDAARAHGFPDWYIRQVATAGEAAGGGPNDAESD